MTRPAIGPVAGQKFKDGPTAIEELTGPEDMKCHGPRPRMSHGVQAAADGLLSEGVTIFEDLVMRQQRQKEANSEEKDGDATWSFVLHSREKKYALFR
jgi:hypothetical protein